jgi:MoxR-like ATPase
MARLENLWCFITTNNARPLSDALLRRCWRFEVPFLPPQVEVSLLGGGKLASLLVRMANRMRSSDGVYSPPALDELKRARALLKAAKSFEDGFVLLKGAIAKSAEDAAFIKQHFKALWEARHE